MLVVTGASASDGDTAADSTTTSTVVSTTTTSTTSTSTTTTEPVDTSTWHRFTTFDDGCDGIGPAPAVGQAQITFVRDGRLHAVAQDTGGQPAPCLLADVGDDPILWGPAGDRLVYGGGRVDVDTSPRLTTSTPGTSFTRPTGRSLIGVDDGRLVKTDVFSGEQVDVSFLARHDDVTYYPSGTHFITAGEATDGTTGIWLSTNVGTDPVLLAESPDTTFSHLTLAEDGTTFAFAADHGGETHVHRTVLAGEELTSSTDEQQAETVLTTDEPIVGVAVGPFGEVAVGYGTCDTAMVTSFEPDVARSGWPVGHLEDGSLVYATSDDGCVDGEGSVWLQLADPDEPPILVVDGVTAVALRNPVGEPPPPPADNLSGFV